MIKLYTNRELSEKLGIKLAKWKRWSREFLPPDPLGGMQSGFARQYYFSDAFHVMLGGHLVADLKFSVYEARRIILDLKGWLTNHGFDQNSGRMLNRQSSELPIVATKIFIQVYQSGNQQIDFTYSIRGILSNRPAEIKGMQIREERYVETIIDSVENKSGLSEIAYEKILNISLLYQRFIDKLGIKGAVNEER